MSALEQRLGGITALGRMGEAEEMRKPRCTWLQTKRPM